MRLHNTSKIIFMLIGSDKSTQKADIKQAQTIKDSLP
ncbi:hypothetical protein KKB_06988 [Kingella kingae PYKK081]|nr:hypothetical protein KKB_06988 [Kingella kingae PYKK081]